MMNFGPIDVSWAAPAPEVKAERKGMGERVMSALTFGSGGYGWPGSWSADRREQALHLKHFVYCAVNAICEEVAGLTPNVALVRSDPEKAPSSRFTSFPRQQRFRKSLKNILPHEEIEPVGDDHPLQRLLRKPNEIDVSWTLWYELTLMLKLTGTAYLWCVPNRMGLPCELVVIPSHWVWPRTSKGHVIDHYDILPWMGGVGGIKFPREEVVYCKVPNPFHKIDGYSPLSAGAETVDAFESVQRSRYWSFKNGCFPVGTVEFDKDAANPTDDDIARIEAKFFAKYQGEANTGRPVILGPGGKFNPLTIAPAEMAYVESATQLRDWILALYKVPKDILGIEPGGDNLSRYAAHAQFCRFAVAPLLVYLSQVLTEQLAHRWDMDLRVWWDDPVPDDPADLRANFDLAGKYGGVTPNDARSMLLHLDHFPHGGDDPLVSSGMTEVPYATGETYGLNMPTVPQRDPLEEEQGATVRLDDHKPQPVLPPQDDEDSGQDEEEDEPKKPGNFGKRLKAKLPDLIDLPDYRQDEDFDCGACCFRMAADHFGLTPEEDDEEGFIDLLGTTEEGGTSPASILRAAQTLGLDAQEVEGWDALTACGEAGKPVLCPVQKGGTRLEQDAAWEGHWVAVVGVTPKSVYVQDPIDGLRRIGKGLWLERWHDKAADGTEYQQYGIALSKPAKRFSRNGHTQRLLVG